MYRATCNYGTCIQCTPLILQGHVICTLDHVILDLLTFRVDLQLIKDVVKNFKATSQRVFYPVSDLSLFLLASSLLIG